MGNTILQIGWCPYTLVQGPFIEDFLVLNNNQQPLSEAFELGKGEGAGNKASQQWEEWVPVLPQIIASPCFHLDRLSLE